MNVIKRIKNFPKGVKASIAFFISSLITKGIAFITTPIFTRLLTTEEYGKVALFSTWFQLFGIVAMFCLYYAVFNVGMMDYPDRRDDFSFSLLILANIITFIFGGIVIAAYPLIKNVVGLELSYIILMFVLYLTQPAYLFWVVKERYEYKYKWVVAFAIISAIIGPLIAIICITQNSGNKVAARIYGFEIPVFLLHLCFYIFLGLKAKWKVDTSFWKKVILYNIPLIPHYLSTYLLNSSDRIMISYIVNDKATAYYSLAYSIASIALIIWNAIDNSLVPYTFEKLKAGEEQDVKSVANPLIFVFACGCFGVILLAPEALMIMGTKEYSEAIYVIPPIVGGVFFQVQYFLYSNVLYYYKKPKFVMLGSICAVVCNLILNYIFINLYGYIAAGYTTLLCYAIQATIDYIAMTKISKVKVYDVKFIIILSVIIAMCSIISGTLYDYLFIRILLLLCFFIVLFVMRKTIIQSIRISRKKGNNNE